MARALSLDATARLPRPRRLGGKHPLSLRTVITHMRLDVVRGISERGDGVVMRSRPDSQPGKRFSIAVVSRQVFSSLLVCFPTVTVHRLARFSLLSEVGAMATT